jgi:hypothetical protein
MGQGVAEEQPMSRSSNVGRTLATCRKQVPQSLQNPHGVPRKSFKRLTGRDFQTLRLYVTRDPPSGQLGSTAPQIDGTLNPTVGILNPLLECSVYRLKRSSAGPDARSPAIWRALPVGRFRHENAATFITNPQSLGNILGRRDSE